MLHQLRCVLGDKLTTPRVPVVEQGVTVPLSRDFGYSGGQRLSIPCAFYGNAFMGVRPAIGEDDGDIWTGDDVQTSDEGEAA